MRANKFAVNQPSPPHKIKIDVNVNLNLLKCLQSKDINEDFEDEDFPKYKRISKT